MTTFRDAGRGTTDAGPQRRSFALDGAQLRSTPNGTGGEVLTFSGYACVTNRSYEMTDLAGPYPELVRSGAFADTLGKNPDVPLLLNHDGLTLARTKSGTLTLSEDSTGLLTEARLDPKNSIVQNIRSAMERRDLDEMSFAFRVNDLNSGWNDDYTERSFGSLDINKGDVSVVTFGANPHTAGASMRSLERFLSALTPEQAEVARRRLGTAGTVPADLASYVARAAALRRGSSGRHTRKTPPPPDLKTYMARAFALRTGER